MSFEYILNELHTAHSGKCVSDFCVTLHCIALHSGSFNIASHSKDNIEINAKRNLPRSKTVR